MKKLQIPSIFYDKIKRGCLFFKKSVLLAVNLSDMETLRLQFDSDLKEQIMTFLDTLPAKKMEIFWQDDTFEHNKKVLNHRYSEFKNGKVKIFTEQELESLLENNVLV